ncbi:MAG: SDR family oxidoreductase [Calditrichia bacterium]
MFEKGFMKNKVVLITGGGSGLGYAMAQKFSEFGSTVIICGRTEEKLKKAVENLPRPYNQTHLYFLCDVRDEWKVKKMIDDIFIIQKKLDVIINNAAGNFFSLSEELSLRAFKTVVEIVLDGTFNVSMAAARHWKKLKQPGNIINIVTTYAESGSGYVLPSAVSKAGVLAMTKSLAYEWGELGIRVNSIAPGPFPTKGAWDRLMPDPGFEEKYKNSLPLKRFGNPEELANLALFLASDLSAYINGENIIIDGAEHLKSGQFNMLQQFFKRDELHGIFQKIRERLRNNK